MHDAQGSPETQHTTRRLDCLQDSGFVEAVGETLSVQPESGQMYDREQQPNQSLQDPDPVPQFQILPLEIGVRLLKDADADEWARGTAQPPGDRGTRNPEAGDDARVPSLAKAARNREIAPLLDDWMTRLEGVYIQP